MHVVRKQGSGDPAAKGKMLSPTISHLRDVVAFVYAYDSLSTGAQSQSSSQGKMTWERSM